MALSAQTQAALYYARKRRRIAASLVVDGTPVLTGTVSVAYDGFTLSATGGEEPYTYQVMGGSLPPGITLDADTGEVAGTPTEAGAFPVRLGVVDAYGNHQYLPSFTITVAA